MDLPYLTANLPPACGRIKLHAEDFRVDEVPLYAASGSGTHVYFQVRKVGVPTSAAIERIARHMHVRPHEIGAAGLKDAHAVTTQWLSLEHADSDRLAAYSDPSVRIVAVTRHTNKLRPGHLAGNRFEIRIRDVAADGLPAATAVLAELQRRGVPNYFGPQRFGRRRDTHRLGELLVRGELAEFVTVLLGRALPGDPPGCKAARDAFDTGFLNRALGLWPRSHADQRRALAAYRKKTDPAAAVRAVDKRLKRLYVSAFQSEMFNAVLARRIDAPDRVTAGDVAQKTDTGGCFEVQDVEVDQARAERGEISPTGPVFGYRTKLASGRAGEIERQVLTERHVEPEAFRRLGPLKAKGTRRALRFLIADPEIRSGSDEAGEFLLGRFAAPAGCYATSLLREIMKNDP